MSASPIITLGYGSTFGLPALIITLGYGISTTPPPVVITDTHDLPRQLSEDYKKHLKKREQALEAKRLEKVEEARKLREDIDRARGILPEDDGSIAVVEPIIAKREIILDPLPGLLVQLDIVKHHLALLNQEQHQLALEARRKRDEEDIQVLLHALSLH